ncbi:Bromodomain adjacent to zinc finger domain protein 1A [Chamberlinius hualienensis]
MPLLRQQTFIRQALPENLDPEEELFYCKLTNEVFRDYDAFFERIILCNSLVWTCEMTGKPGLTYAEALESEEAARTSLKGMPFHIKRLILYFGRLSSKRLRLGEVCDDVFSYMKGRFFVGEEVDVVVNGNRKLCTVVKVIAPRTNRKKSSDHSVENGKDDSVEDDSCPDIDSSKYKYRVRPADEPDGEQFYITPPDIQRKKRVYSREKNKLFLKHTCDMVSNFWIVKPQFLEKYRVSEMRFKDIFGGNKPNFEAISVWRKQQAHHSTTPVSNSKVKSKMLEKRSKKFTDGPPSKKRKVSGSAEKDSKAARDAERIRMNKEAALAVKKAKRAIEERRKAKEEQKKQLIEQRIKMKEEKEKEREKLKEEKRMLAECLREWQKPRDDLECDDLIELPSFSPVNCALPNDLFGDAVMILEFINNFSEQLLIKDIFPQGLNFDHLEKAVADSEIQGPLSDLLQLLLKVIFRFQEEEEEYIANVEKPVNNSIIDDGTANDGENARNVLSTVLSSHGVILRKLTLDPFTLTEILRLHLIASGSRPNALDPSSRDDPGLQLVREEPELIKQLSYKTVFELNAAEKLKILHVLVNQLLSHVAIHDEIDERLEKLKVAKLDLRQWQWAEQRREKEEASARMKKRAEDKKAAENEPLKRADERKQKDIEEEERAAELEMKHKQEYLRKEREFSESVFKLQHRGTLLPLGRDRAYRRYWMFSALPGLYVEDDETEVGSCLTEPTPIDPNVNANMSFNLSVNLARHQALKSCSGVSGKENDTSIVKSINGLAGSLTKSHKLLSDNHPTINGLIDNKLKSFQTDGEELNSTVEKPVMFGICSANGDKCPTHGTWRKSTAVRWAFVSTTTQLEALITSLNPRGFREGSLKEILVAEKKRVLQSVVKCPSQKLNPEAVKLSDSSLSEVRKSSRLQTSINAVAIESSISNFVELTLSDSILELEEKIYAGGLGSIKAIDRNAWRDAIVNDVFCGKGDVNGESKELQSSDSLVNGHIDTGGKKDNEAKIEAEKINCRVSRSKIIDKLATSLLQIFQGIEPKYLIPPLGVNREADVSGKSPPNNLAVRWEESLASCASFSQIFIHLSTLKKSVAWSRSVLNARCRICRRKGDAEHMLLCDGCDRGHHMYCLHPALLEIPEGDWLCPDCCPKEPKPKNKKKRSIAKEEDVERIVKPEKTNGAEIDPIEQAVGEAVGEFSKHIVEEPDEMDEDDESEMCSVCEKGGEVISCEMCFLAFHLKCVKPILRRFPRGKWCCPKCSELTKELRQPPSKSKKSIEKEKSSKKSLEAKDSKQASDLGTKRNGVSIGGKDEELTETSSPRRSERNLGRKINYRKHSLYESDDDWVAESPTKKSKRSTNTKLSEDLSDEEYYGLTKRHSPPSRRGASGDVPLDYKTCDQLLTELVRHEDGWPFLRPVGKKEVPSYHEIIKRPMDFGTMRSRLNDMVYLNNKEFVADTFLIFQNCCIFNPADSVQYKAAERISRFFNRRIKEVRLNLIMEKDSIHQPSNESLVSVDTVCDDEFCRSSESDLSEAADNSSCSSMDNDQDLTNDESESIDNDGNFGATNISKPTESDLCSASNTETSDLMKNDTTVSIEKINNGSMETDSCLQPRESLNKSTECDILVEIEKPELPNSEPVLSSDNDVVLDCEVEMEQVEVACDDDLNNTTTDEVEVVSLENVAKVEMEEVNIVSNCDLPMDESIEVDIISNDDVTNVGNATQSNV